MATMPQSVKIAPFVYTIQHSHEAVVEYGKTDGTDVYGCCQNRICNIIIDEGYPIQRERKTLLHELIHAVHRVCDVEEINLKGNEEHYVALVSAALLSLLQDNPELVAYLTGDKEVAQQPGYCLEPRKGMGNAAY